MFSILRLRKEICRQWELNHHGRADYGPSPAEIVGLNPTGGMDVCLLCVLCVASPTCFDWSN